MGKLNITSLIKVKLASFGFKLFLWGNNYSEEEYWEIIYQQEKAFKKDNNFKL